MIDRSSRFYTKHFHVLNLFQKHLFSIIVFITNGILILLLPQTKNLLSQGPSFTTPVLLLLYWAFVFLVLAWYIVSLRCFPIQDQKIESLKPKWWITKRIYVLYVLVLWSLIWMPKVSEKLKFKGNLIAGLVLLALGVFQIFSIWGSDTGLTYSLAGMFCQNIGMWTIGAGTWFLTKSICSSIKNMWTDTIELMWIEMGRFLGWLILTIFFGELVWFVADKAYLWGLVSYRNYTIWAIIHLAGFSLMLARLIDFWSNQKQAWAIRPAALALLIPFFLWQEFPQKISQTDLFYSVAKGSTKTSKKNVEPEEPEMVSPFYAQLRDRISAMPKDEPVVFVAASGGGSRAAIFSSLVLDALARTNLKSELDCTGVKTKTRSWADQIALISSVSGGSLATAHFLCNGCSKSELREFPQYTIQEDLITGIDNATKEMMYPQKNQREFFKKMLNYFSANSQDDASAKTSSSAPSSSNLTDIDAKYVAMLNRQLVKFQNELDQLMCSVCNTCAPQSKKPEKDYPTLIDPSSVNLEPPFPQNTSTPAPVPESEASTAKPVVAGNNTLCRIYGLEDDIRLIQSRITKYTKSPESRQVQDLLYKLKDPEFKGQAEEHELAWVIYSSLVDDMCMDFMAPILRGVCTMTSDRGDALTHFWKKKLNWRESCSKLGYCTNNNELPAFSVRLGEGNKKKTLPVVMFNTTNVYNGTRLVVCFPRLPILSDPDNPGFETFSGMVPAKRFDQLNIPLSRAVCLSSNFPFGFHVAHIDFSNGENPEQESEKKQNAPAYPQSAYVLDGGIIDNTGLDSIYGFLIRLKDGDEIKDSDNQASAEILDELEKRGVIIVEIDSGLKPHGSQIPNTFIQSIFMSANAPMNGLTNAAYINAKRTKQFYMEKLQRSFSDRFEIQHIVFQCNYFREENQVMTAWSLGPYDKGSVIARFLFSWLQHSPGLEASRCVLKRERRLRKTELLYDQLEKLDAELSKLSYELMPRISSLKNLDKKVSKNFDKNKEDYDTLRDQYWRFLPKLSKFHKFLNQYQNSEYHNQFQLNEYQKHLNQFKQLSSDFKAALMSSNLHLSNSVTLNKSLTSSMSNPTIMDPLDITMYQSIQLNVNETSFPMTLTSKETDRLEKEFEENLKKSERDLRARPLRQLQRQQEMQIRRNLWTKSSFRAADEERRWFRSPIVQSQALPSPVKTP